MPQTKKKLKLRFKTIFIHDNLLSSLCSFQPSGTMKEIFNGRGRKVVEVRDGETVTDDVEVPTYNLPTGNPLVVGNFIGYYQN